MEKMMKSEIPPQRWFALALLVFFVILFCFFSLVPFISSGLDYHDQKQELVFRLQRTKRTVSKKDSVLQNIASLKEQYGQQNYFNTNETVALASAELQRIIKESISQAGGQLTSTQVLPSKNEQRLNKVIVKVRMKGDIEALRSVLYKLETSLPILIVDQLDARPERGRRERRTRKLMPSNDINISFQVTGFMRASHE